MAIPLKLVILAFTLSLFSIRKVTTQDIGKVLLFVMSHFMKTAHRHQMVLSKVN